MNRTLVIALVLGLSGFVLAVENPGRPSGPAPHPLAGTDRNESQNDALADIGDSAAVWREPVLAAKTLEEHIDNALIKLGKTGDTRSAAVPAALALRSMPSLADERIHLERLKAAEFVRFKCLIDWSSGPDCVPMLMKYAVDPPDDPGPFPFAGWRLKLAKVSGTWTITDAARNDEKGGAPTDEKPRPIERLSTEWVGPQHGIKIRAEIFPETFRIGESARAHLFFDRIGQSSLPADIEISSTVTAGEGKFFCTTEHTVQKPETASEVLQRGTLILQWKPWGPNRGAVQAEARPGPAEVKFMILMLDQEGKGQAELDIPAQKINILPRQAGGEWSNVVGLVGRLIFAEPKIPFGGRLRPRLELRNAHYGGGPWLAVRTGYPHLIEVQIADADGKMIQPTVQRAEVLVRPMWAVIRPFPGETLEIPVGIEGLGGSNADAHLSTVAGVWKLPPGKYKLSATYASPSPDDIQANPGPQGATVWKGKLVLPPVEVEILPPAKEPDRSLATERAAQPEAKLRLALAAKTLELEAATGKSFRTQREWQEWGSDERRTLSIRADFIEAVQKMLPEGWSVERRVWSGSSGCTMVLKDAALPSSSSVHEGNAVLCILPQATDEQPGTADGRGKTYTPILKAANGTAHLWADAGNWKTIEGDLAKALVGEPMPVAPFLVDFTNAAGVRQRETIRANWLQLRWFSLGLESFEKECRSALGRQPVADLRKVEIKSKDHDADRYHYDGVRQMQSRMAFHAGLLLPGQQVAIHTTYRPLFAVEQFRIQLGVQAYYFKSRYFTLE